MAPPRIVSVPTFPTVTPAATRVAARSLLATGETVGFTVMAHTFAGGQAPSPLQILVLTTVVFAAACGVIGGRLRLRVVAPFIAATQIGLHFAFLHAASAPTGAPTVSPTYGHMMAMEPGASSATLIHATDVRMLVTHFVIALVTTLVLMVQERALGALAALVTGGVISLGPTAARLPTLRSTLHVAGRQAVLLSAATRRGPPLPAC